MATPSDFDRVLLDVRRRLQAAQKIDQILASAQVKKPVDRRSLRKVSFKEMRELVEMHFSEMFAKENCWDNPNVFDMPMYLIEDEPGWNEGDLDYLCDLVHNGPPCGR